MNKYNKILLTIMLSFIIIFINNNDITYASEKASYTKGHYLIINTKHNKLAYFKDGKFIREFETGTGRKRNTLTPEGKFRVANKIVDRPYYSGGIPGGHPDNPLGDRWIGLNVNGTQGSTYGIHGNNDESSIGKNVSAGCIRMHNDEVRWLFSQVPVGSYAIVDYTDDDYYTLAKRYGVRLDPKSRLNTDQKNVMKEFKDLYIYGPKSNPTIDLSNWREPITKVSQAEGILRTTSNGKKYDRKYFQEAWARLTSSEKLHPQMKKVFQEYDQIIQIAQASEYTLKFYDNVYDNAKKLIEDPKESSKLNSKGNKSSGARGKAYDEYMNATHYIENSKTSPRMKYINDKYLDAVYFLHVSNYIGDENISKSKEYANKIKNSYLKNIAKSNISDLEDYKSKKSSVESAFKKFYIYGKMSNPTIDLSNKSEPITKVSQAEGILKTTVDGKIYDRQNFLNKWNTLSSRDKKHDDMKDIWDEYNKIISITEASRDTLKFYDNVYENAEELILDANKSVHLNSKDNLSEGSRGKAYKEYMEATKHGENSKNSARMKYINDKYLDAIYFLRVAEYIGQSNEEMSLDYLSKIKNTYLKNIAEEGILNSQGYNENKVKLENAFYNFSNFKFENQTLNLIDKNNTIESIEVANNILSSDERQNFETIWISLPEGQKDISYIKEIKSEYDKIIEVLEGVVACIEFFETVKGNSIYLLENPNEAIHLNSKENLENGSRGKAYKEYMQAVEYGENSKNSPRMKFVNDKYLDAIYFLNVSELISLDEKLKAESDINKIKDIDLKNCAEEYFQKNYTK